LDKLMIFQSQTIWLYYFISFTKYCFWIFT